MIFELEWHIGLSVLPSKPAHHILSQSQYAGARPSLMSRALVCAAISENKEIHNIWETAISFSGFSNR